jgi:hypothetical protein
MTALLKLIPGSDIFYATIIGLLLIVGGGAWVHHDHVEQAKGAAVVAAQDTKLADVTKQRDDALAAAAAHDLDEIGVTYHAKIALPAVADTGIVCRSTAVPAVRDAATAAAGSQPGTNAGPVLPSSGGFDPSGPTLTALRDADGQVIGLQATVARLEKYIADLQAASGKPAPAH